MLKERCSLFVLWSQLFLGGSRRSDTFPETAFLFKVEATHGVSLYLSPQHHVLTQLPSWKKTVHVKCATLAPAPGPHVGYHVQLSRAKPTAGWINQPLRSQTDGTRRLHSGVQRMEVALSHPQIPLAPLI